MAATAGPKCSARHCAMCSRCKSPVQTLRTGTGASDLIRCKASVMLLTYGEYGHRGQPMRGSPKVSACRQITSMEIS
eukprot:scaffold290294_cov32-Tisochrysis_lutea.AAC.1